MKRKFSDPASSQVHAEEAGPQQPDLIEAKATPALVGEVPNTEAVSNRGPSSPKLVVDAASHVTHKNLVVEPEGTATPTHPNQDRILCRIGNEIYNQKKPPTQNFKKLLESIFVVCDGHGTNGEVAAEFFTSYLADALEDAFFELETSDKMKNLSRKSSTNTAFIFWSPYILPATVEQMKNYAKDIFCRVFVEADNAYRTTGHPSVSKRGTMRSGGAATTVAVVFSHFVILANAGDR